MWSLENFLLLLQQGPPEALHTMIKTAGRSPAIESSKNATLTVCALALVYLSRHCESENMTLSGLSSQLGLGQEKKKWIGRVSKLLLLADTDELSWVLHLGWRSFMSQKKKGLASEQRLRFQKVVIFLNMLVNMLMTMNSKGASIATLASDSLCSMDFF
mmetsp:Transcript_39572/g.61818  ORF Transcript_39572/g.61818 Transcript_39572/m.61818 type:complete len:159 (+) Transcript_39572:22-498(+)